MEERESAVDVAAAWDERYQRGEAGWDLGGPAPPLEHWLAQEAGQMPGQRAAVLGCGYGHDALLFARAGCIVTGFDFAPSAVHEARARAAAAGAPAEFEQADIFTLPDRYGGAFDLVVEHTCFCAIDRARRVEYVAVVRDILAPRGRLVGLFWTHGRSGGPPYTTSRQEVMALFAPDFVVESLERAPDSVARRANEELLAVLRKRT